MVLRFARLAPQTTSTIDPRISRNRWARFASLPGTMTQNTLGGVLPPAGLRRLATRFKLLRNLSNGLRPTRLNTLYKRKRPPRRDGLFRLYGAPGTIRTCDRLVRSQALSPDNSL